MKLERERAQRAEEDGDDGVISCDFPLFFLLSFAKNLLESPVLSLLSSLDFFSVFFYSSVM